MAATTSSSINCLRTVRFCKCPYCYPYIYNSDVSFCFCSLSLCPSFCCRNARISFYPTTNIRLWLYRGTARRRIWLTPFAPRQKFVVDELRHTAVNLFAVIDVFAQIAAIAEYAVKTAFVPQATLRCFYAAFVRKADNVGICSAADEHFKHSFNKRGGFLVNDEVLLFVHLVTEGNASAKIFAFRRGYGYAAFYFCESSAE